MIWAERARQLRLHGLRRAESGVQPRMLPRKLGRVIMGDVAVTLVDLAWRGLVKVTEIRDSETASADWALAAEARLASPPDLLVYEKTLLDGLSGYDQSARLQVLAVEFSLVLGKVRSELIREAMRCGWLRH